ncbi:molybdate transport system substrate-binding protein [Rubritalea squalenifaciens DSM 18772]|uniref:Molybdate transport system substrate-binding protein n=1 Tax=Rubritalea squalenifaciens DSM 18772 TaxID=1123071 RepID=A0A1M6MBR6_9BACT|nr:molybdate ABC transporter substrate-binding protein [Rubritalea squalenifaciens]SHJ80810.1 molybdate transport system substrate-binding protein [Rubritalea squalenifaciens DSM 18772]
MKSPFPIVAVLLTVLAACLWALWPSLESSQNKPSLTVYCAASLRSPMTEIAERFEAEHDITIRLVFNGSGALLSQLQLSGGDLYLPATADYLDQASHLITATHPTSSMTAVLVLRGEEHNILALDDLKREDIRLSFAVENAAIGKFTRQVLHDSEDWAAIEKNITVIKPTVNNTVEDVSLGAVDATIAWDAVALQNKELKIIPLPLFANKPQTTSIAILKSSTQVKLARQFVSYLTEEESSKQTFRKYGFGSVAAD